MVNKIISKNKIKTNLDDQVPLSNCQFVQLCPIHRQKYLAKQIFTKCQLGKKALCLLMVCPNIFCQIVLCNLKARQIVHCQMMACQKRFLSDDSLPNRYLPILRCPEISLSYLSRVQFEFKKHFTWQILKLNLQKKVLFSRKDFHPWELLLIKKLKIEKKTSPLLSYQF